MIIKRTKRRLTQAKVLEVVAIKTKISKIRIEKIRSKLKKRTKESFKDSVRRRERISRRLREHQLTKIKPKTHLSRHRNSLMTSSMRLTVSAQIFSLRRAP